MSSKRAGKQKMGARAGSSAGAANSSRPRPPAKERLGERLSENVGRLQAVASEPTLKDKVSALKLQLGLRTDALLIDAVREANEEVGLEAVGPISEQVDRLLSATGIEVHPGGAKC